MVCVSLLAHTPVICANVSLLFVFNTILLHALPKKATDTAKLFFRGISSTILVDRSFF
jgi:hypothetical protein